MGDGGVQRRRRRRRRRREGEKYVRPVTEDGQTESEKIGQYSGRIETAKSFEQNKQQQYKGRKRKDFNK